MDEEPNSFTTPRRRKPLVDPPIDELAEMTIESQQWPTPLNILPSVFFERETSRAHLVDTNCVILDVGPPPPVWIRQDAASSVDKRLVLSGKWPKGVDPDFMADREALIEKEIEITPPRHRLTHAYRDHLLKVGQSDLQPAVEAPERRQYRLDVHMDLDQDENHDKADEHEQNGWMEGEQGQQGFDIEPEGYQQEEEQSWQPNPQDIMKSPERGPYGLDMQLDQDQDNEVEDEHDHNGWKVEAQGQQGIPMDHNGHQEQVQKDLYRFPASKPPALPSKTVHPSHDMPVPKIDLAHMLSLLKDGTPAKARKTLPVTLPTAAKVISQDLVTSPVSTQFHSPGVEPAQQIPDIQLWDPDDSHMYRGNRSMELTGSSQHLSDDDKEGHHSHSDSPEEDNISRGPSPDQSTSEVDSPEEDYISPAPSRDQSTSEMSLTPNPVHSQQSSSIDTPFNYQLHMRSPRKAARRSGKHLHSKKSKRISVLLQAHSLDTVMLLAVRLLESGAGEEWGSDLKRWLQDLCTKGFEREHPIDQKGLQAYMATAEHAEEILNSILVVLAAGLDTGAVPRNQHYTSLVEVFHKTLHNLPDVHSRESSE